jgi:hypothetical protein
MAGSVRALQEASDQFLLRHEHVEDGEDDGGYGWAREGLYRRRLEMAGEFGFREWGKIGTRTKNSMQLFVLELL